MHSVYERNSYQFSPPNCQSWTMNLLSLVRSCWLWIDLNQLTWTSSFVQFSGSERFDSSQTELTNWTCSLVRSVVMNFTNAPAEPTNDQLNCSVQLARVRSVQLSILVPNWAEPTELAQLSSFSWFMHQLQPNLFSSGVQFTETHTNTQNPAQPEEMEFVGKKQENCDSSLIYLSSQQTHMLWSRCTEIIGCSEIWNRILSEEHPRQLHSHVGFAPSQLERSLTSSNIRESTFSIGPQYLNLWFDVAFRYFSSEMRRDFWERS